MLPGPWEIRSVPVGVVPPPLFYAHFKRQTLTPPPRLAVGSFFLCYVFNYILIAFSLQTELVFIKCKTNFPPQRDLGEEGND